MTDLPDDTDPETLARLAQERPDLWPQIRQHPHCYPELAQWIDRNATMTAPAPPKPTSQEWAARFQQATGREPSMSEFQAAQASGEIADAHNHRDQSVQQMSAGARQLATGVKDFYKARVAPTVEQAGRRVAPTARAATANVPSGWMAKAPLALPVTAFIAIISLFLPVATRRGRAENFFADELSGEGVFLLVSFLVTIVLAVLALISGNRKLRLATGIVGGVVGLIGIIDCFLVMGAVTNGSAVGVGAIIVLLSSVVIVAASAVIFVQLRRERVAGGQSSAP